MSEESTTPATEPETSPFPEFEEFEAAVRHYAQEAPIEVAHEMLGVSARALLGAIASGEVTDPKRFAEFFARADRFLTKRTTAFMVTAETPWPLPVDPNASTTREEVRQLLEPQNSTEGEGTTETTDSSESAEPAAAVEPEGTDAATEPASPEPDQVATPGGAHAEPEELPAPVPAEPEATEPTPEESAEPAAAASAPSDESTRPARMPRVRAPKA